MDAWKAGTQDRNTTTFEPPGDIRDDHKVPRFQLDKIRGLRYAILYLQEKYPTLRERAFAPRVCYIKDGEKFTAVNFDSWCPFHERVHHSNKWFITSYKNSGNTYLGCWHTEEDGSRPFHKVEGFDVFLLTQGEQNMRAALNTRPDRLYAERVLREGLPRGARTDAPN